MSSTDATRVEVDPGPSLCDDELLAMWRFRLTIMKLKPDVDPRQDLATFSAFCRASRAALRIKDGAGAMAGILALTVRRGEAFGRRYSVVLLEYGMLRADLRGHPALSWGMFRCLLHLPWPAPDESWWLACIGYPMAVLAVARNFPPAYLYGDEGVPPQAAHVLDELVTALPPGSWDSEAGCKVMPTIPTIPSARWFARNEHHELYRRYERRCPRWREGYGLPTVCSVSWRNVLGIAGRGARWALP